jgi:hypothetical protein
MSVAQTSNAADETKRIFRPLVIGLALALALLGAALMYGAYRKQNNEYVSSLLIEFGAALFLGVPLLFLERLINRNATKIVKLGEELESTRRDVQEARTRLEELPQAMANRIAARDANDVDLVHRLREEVSEEDIWQLLHRADELRALDVRGIRVRSTLSELWVRFASLAQEADGGEAAVQLSAELRNGDPLVELRSWLSGEAPEDALARLDDDLDRVDKRPENATLDPISVFTRLVETLDTVVSLRSGRQKGSRLGPVVELVGDWAITTNGIEHAHDETRTMDARELLRDPGRARSRLTSLNEVEEPDDHFDEAFDTAREYHSGKARRAARERVRGSRP